MLSIIRAEFYRLFNRVYLYVFFGILIVISVLTALTMNFPLNEVLSVSIFALIIPVFLWPFLVDIVCGEEFTENTFVNTLAFGVSKTAIFISKVIVSSILVIITVLVTVVTFLSSVFAFANHNGITPEPLLGNYILAIFAALPLYISAIIIGILLMFVIKKNSLANLTYLVLFLCVNPLFELLRLFGVNLEYLTNFMITKQLVFLMGEIRSVNINTPKIKMNIIGGSIASQDQMLTAAVIGLIYIISLLLLSVPVIRRK